MTDNEEFEKVGANLNKSYKRQDMKKSPCYKFKCSNRTVLFKWVLIKSKTQRNKVIWLIHFLM